ncbi:biotin--[acetyl-CoA-carboxylase] ligase [Temperatibacter marinus]|uniref:Biotin--[acetyl-CoA-carboxylase] ligase n=1 Tax=Temperatibacter marinus TaxID=1456591 RepID=A0AA52EBP5_9PROT|nr:biotin--[acetyl-CoA-carboxylase] ligase [Temperatibacter marinus]WND02402.1 biotin--[acetyl-CoA-carboxylase] ligase [Temperatibacter marinus]
MLNSAEENWSALVPSGTEAFFFSSLSSTNECATSLAQKGEKGPLWILAGSQSAGRGRRGRQWTSYQGNFFGSLLLRPSMKASDCAALPFAVALAIRDALIDCGVRESSIQCKWPNDILIDGCKVSGVLIESAMKADHSLEYLVIGIGVNLTHSPQETKFDAVCLKQKGIEISVKEFTRFLSLQCEAYLQQWINKQDEAIYASWSAVGWGLGQKRLIRTATETFTGVIQRLGVDGGLIVMLDDGREKCIYAGDVFPPNKS